MAPPDHNRKGVDDRGATMTDELIVLLGGATIGRLRRDRRGRISFTYDESFRNERDAYPLSLSMPLARAEHCR